MRQPKLQISPPFYVYLCVLLLIFPLKWVACWYVAVAFHELCHVLAIIATGSQINGITISIGGATIQTRIQSRVKEVICTIAGPMGSSLLLLAARLCPELALCGFIQCAFNLLPIYPLDGGRALYCLTEIAFGRVVADAIMLWVKRITLIVAVALSVYLSIHYRVGLLPVIASVALIFKSRNITCKQGLQRVQ